VKEKLEVPVEVLEQLEMVRMQGRFNMIDNVGVQRAAHDLEFHELVCFIEDLERGKWMRLLNALGEFTNGMPQADRAALVDRLADLVDDEEEE